MSKWVSEKLLRRRGISGDTAKVSLRAKGLINWLALGMSSILSRKLGEGGIFRLPTERRNGIAGRMWMLVDTRINPHGAESLGRRDGMEIAKDDWRCIRLE